MRLLADNDALWKLAACDLLDETLRVLELEASEVFVLDSAAFKLGVRGAPKQRAKARAKYGDAVVDRLSAFLDQVGTVGWVSRTDPLLTTFERIERIDAGEAVLVAAALSSDVTPLVTTGDKAFLEALASAEEASTIRPRLAGRFIGLEQLLDRIWRESGFEFLRSRIVGLLPLDTATRIVFSRGDKTPEDQARQALDAYLADLRRCAGVLLID